MNLPGYESDDKDAKKQTKAHIVKVPESRRLICTDGSKAPLERAHIGLYSVLNMRLMAPEHILYVDLYSNRARVYTYDGLVHILASQD